MSERISLQGGRIKLYKRGAVWQCKIKVPGSTGHKIKSCDTTNQHEATAFAMNLYDELYIHVKMGGKLRTKTFRQVFDEWRTDHEKRIEIVDRVAVYAVPFLGADSIDRISGARVAEFWKHRRSNYKKKPPQDSTLIREMTALRSVFTFAKACGYITEVPELDSFSFSRKMNRKDDFTAKEWVKIRDSMPSWIAQEGIATTRDRQLAADYFTILSLTGIRVGEARSLAWENIRHHGQHLILEVSGKTGTREVVCLKGAEAAFDRVKKITGKNALVFCHPDGRPIGSFKTSFHRLLEHAKVEKGNRSIYSIRHMFISERLRAGVSIHAIALQCGTSTEMITKVYSHVVSTEVAEQITRQELLQGFGATLEEFIDDN